jgi:hypothetical protein
MKNLSLKLVLFLAILIATLSFASCSNDDSASKQSCEPIPCYNGGISNSDCGCDCPLGYEGINCSIQKKPIAIYITKIKVLQFPNKNLSNGSWDSSGDAPDITIKLTSGIKPFDVLFESPNFFPDAVSNSTSAYNFIPSAPIEINSIDNPLILSILDYDLADNNPSEDDYMGGIGFFIYNQGDNFPASITIKNTEAQLMFELYLSYQW